MQLFAIVRKKIYTILGFVATVYFLSLALFYVFSNKLIFQRTQLPLEYKFTFEEPFEEYFINTPDQVKLHAVLFNTKEEPKGLIFYLHGNADNLSRWGKYAVDFTELGYDVFMMDYRGYGKSEGKPNEEKLHQDAAFMLNWVNTNIPHQNIIVYGRSLGSAIATQLAVRTAPNLLILETPFANLSDVVYWPLKPALYLFPIQAKFSNEAYLENVECPKIIFQGTNDWVVPLSSAMKLKPLLDQPDNFIVIEGAGHKNIRDFGSYHTRLKEILK